MRIYVGNLPFTADEAQVRQLFAQHGTVESVALINDRETGRPRGFGFVEMPRPDAQRAIQSLNGKDMGGRPLRVNEAQERQKEREQRSKLQRVVFVKNGETVKMQKVETGIADNTFIEIRSGLKPGEEVVSGSYTAISRRLKDGAKVAIEKEEGKT